MARTKLTVKRRQLQSNDLNQPPKKKRRASVHSNSALDESKIKNNLNEDNVISNSPFTDEMKIKESSDYAHNKARNVSPTVEIEESNNNISDNLNEQNDSSKKDDDNDKEIDVETSNEDNQSTSDDSSNESSDNDSSSDDDSSNESSDDDSSNENDEDSTDEDSSSGNSDDYIDGQMKEEKLRLERLKEWPEYDKTFHPPLKARADIQLMKPIPIIKDSTVNSNHVLIELQCICNSILHQRIFSIENDLFKGKISCDLCEKVIFPGSVIWECNAFKPQIHGWYWSKENNRWIKLTAGYASCDECIKTLHPEAYKHLGKSYDMNELTELCLPKYLVRK